MRLLLLAAFFLGGAFGQVVITNTGSTNMPGLSVTLGSKSHAVAERRGTKVKLNLQSELHARLMQDLEAAGPLDQLTVRHCAKSVSFGTSTFVTYKNVRSPDISCGGQSDPAVAALQKDVEEIIRQAHEKLPVERFGRSNRMIEKQ